GGTDAPPADAGAGGDSGVSTGPAPGAFGATCGSDDDCNSKTCRNYNGGTLICTQTCDGRSPCPTGYDCTKGFCFAKPDTGNHVTTTTTTTGCAAAPAAPAPWGAIGLGLLGFGLVRRRRRG